MPLLQTLTLADCVVIVYTIGMIIHRKIRGEVLETRARALEDGVPEVEGRVLDRGHDVCKTDTMRGFGVMVSRAELAQEVSVASECPS